MYLPGAPERRNRDGCKVSVDFKKLRSFVSVVDAGSMSRAANALRIAQPALSQHMASLEAHFKHKLLLRSNHGVVPTEAGFALYRHAQAMLKQLELAQRDVTLATASLQGQVSVGLATFSGASELAGPLLVALAGRHPDVVLNVSDSFGNVLSELVMSGRLDMALIYSFGTIKGVRLQPLFREEFLLVAPRSLKLAGKPDQALPIAALQGVKLLLPGRYHFLRRLIEASFAHVRITPRVAAEIESTATLSAALDSGLGATIVPEATAKLFSSSRALTVRRLTKPEISATVSLCISDHLPLSQAALVVRELLLQQVELLADLGKWVRLDGETPRSLKGLPVAPP
jgi:LysR family transcriptional regulator, nitrogen assimilation regulatory protein